MEKSDCVERLMLFNERAAELTSYSFAKMIGRLIFSNERVVGFTLSRRDGLLLFQRYGPERESIKSFVSAYRQFTLDTDRISIRNMSTIYGETWISQDKTNEFERQRTEINDILNSNFDVVINGEIYTNKRIQDIFIYGDIIHIQEEEKEIFDSWKRNVLLYKLIEDGFVLILGSVLTGIVGICNLNRRVLKEIEDGG